VRKFILKRGGSPMSPRTTPMTESVLAIPYDVLEEGESN